MTSKLTKKDILLTLEYLKNALRYDRQEGKLYWSEERPENHFKSLKGYKYYLKNFAGTEAGYIREITENLKYRYLVINGVHIYAHQIIWFMENGNWPIPMTDHKDGDGLNNKINNLQPCTSSTNQKNTIKYKNNKTTVTGVVNYHAKSGGYVVYIGSKRLGYFQDFFEAVCARKSAEIAAGYSERNGK